MAKYCSKCGKELPDEALFCDSCGTKVGSTQDDSESRKRKDSRGSRKTDTPKKNRKPEKSSGGFFGKLIITALVVVLSVYIGMTVWSMFSPARPSASSQDSSASDVKPTAAAVQTPAALPSSEQSQGTAVPSVQTDVTASSSPEDVSQGLLKPDGDPSFDEFGYDELFHVTGLPMDRFDEYTYAADGEWKYFIAFNSNIDSERIDEIGLAEIGLGEDTCTMVWHPKQIKYTDGTVFAEDDETVGYTVFTGRWDENGMVFQGNGLTVTSSAFYSYEGKQYLLAAVLSEDGMICDLMLMRP